jgi:Rad3-related DNA helicase
VALPTLIEAVRHAFSPGGPVERVLGQHRQPQTTFALDLATYVEATETEIAALIKEAFAGSGKTDAVLVVVGLYGLISQRKSLITTFKRSLRGDYLSAMDKTNRIIEMTLHDLDASEYFEVVSIGEYKSPMSYLSPSKMATLESRINNGIITATKDLSVFLRTYQEFIAAGIDPEFTDIYEQCPLPTETTEIHWAFCPSDRESDLWQRILDQHETAKNCDIVLVTHAMLIRNSLAKGAVLNTTDDGDEVLDEDEQAAILRDGAVIIDEAEKLPNAAYDTVSATVSLNDLRDLVADVLSVYNPDSSRSTKILALGEQETQAGLAVIGSWLESKHERIIVVDSDDDLSHQMTGALQTVDQGLRRFSAVAHGVHGRDVDIMLADRISRIRQEIAMILNADTYDFAKMAIRAVNDGLGGDVQVGINFGSGRHLINQLWREPHSFSSVAMISATLTDMPPYQTSYRRFLTAIGYDVEQDRIQISDPLRREVFGRINEVIVAHRKAPHPTDAGDVDHINQDFVVFAGTALTAFANRQLTMPPETRLLVLFPSYRLLDRVWQRVTELQARIKRTQRGSNLKKAMAEYAAKPHGIWFGVELEGVNFIDPNTKRTLADLMVIVRIPQPPSDDIRVSRLTNTFGDTAAAQRRAEAVALMEASNSAYRRTVQAVARGLRNADDVVQALMILDIRFPVPFHVTETRRIARSAGDSTKLFANFDSCLEGYRVRQWSQVETEGEFTRIL